MLEKEATYLSFIKRGAIDYYYALKIETDLDNPSLWESLDDGINKIFNEYDKVLKASFTDNINEAIQNIGAEGVLKVKKFRSSKGKKAAVEATSKVVQQIAVDLTENGFSITPVTDVHNYLKALRDESNADYNFSKSVYGISYADNQTRFLLPPFKAKLVSGAEVFIHALLYVFANKTAVLRITLPIENVDIQPIFDNDYDVYIEEMCNSCSFPIEPADKTIGSLKDSYCNFLANFKGIKSITGVGMITNIILSEHDAIPESIESLDTGLKEVLYKIAVAPFQVRSGVSYIKEAEKYLQNNSYTVNGMSYITSNMGKCISLVDKNVINFAVENGISDRERVYYEMIGTMRRNVEYTLLMLMLKKVNYTYTFLQKGSIKADARKVQEEFYKDIIFISVLQEDVFGSVREQVEDFEKKMIYFLDMKNAQERLNAVDRIIEDEKENRYAELQNLVSAGGLLFAVVFGLPAITETLTLIRGLCGFISRDIPVLTIDNLSFAAWLGMVAALTAVLVRKWKKRKK